MDWPAGTVAFDAAGDLAALSSSLQGRPVAFVARADGAPPEGAVIAVQPELEYVLYDLGPRVICVAKDALARVLAEGWPDHLAIKEVRLNGQAEPMRTASMTDPARILAYASGEDLVGLPCRHPASGQVSAIAAREAVALEEGTGLELHVPASDPGRVR